MSKAMKLQTPKGFRDFLPKEALKRKFVLEKIEKVFAKFGFDPLETPTLEYAETLKGKYGEEERLIYEFKDRGGDELALRYDQTVPAARVVAEYGPNGKQLLPIPFKRYQIQTAYRGENTQKGRYREFLQCDGDIIGVNSPLADTEILSLVYEIYRELGLEIIIKINDRAEINDIPPKFLSAIDKLNKIGKKGVLTELEEKGLSPTEAVEVFDNVISKQLSPTLNQIVNLFNQMGYPKEILQFDPALIRGLDYYTGLIFEVVLRFDQNSSSLCGGGRYDKLIGKFIGSDIPATGFAIGFDRTIEALEEAGKLSVCPTLTQILVTVFNPELQADSLKLCQALRLSNINCELWLNPIIKLDKQLKYADQKGIPYVAIIGPDEVKKESVTLKDLRNQSQETVLLEELVKKLCELLTPS